MLIAPTSGFYGGKFVRSGRAYDAPAKPKKRAKRKKTSPVKDVTPSVVGDNLPPQISDDKPDSTK